MKKLIDFKIVLKRAKILKKKSKIFFNLLSYDWKLKDEKLSQKDNNSSFILLLKWIINIFISKIIIFFLFIKYNML